ncbi:ubiquitin-like-specific protease 1D-like, partial [Trifolium medium]|nr:ubiquitin-like-specific protease 1D-like [Trifolium medium]
MEEQQQQPQQRKGPIPLDWDTLLDDTPAAELVVKPSAMASDQEPQSFVPGLEDLKDYELDEQIRRKKNTLNTAGRNLPDRGAKLRAVIRCYEEEVHRRK